LKQPVLKDESSEPTPDRFDRWWPHSTSWGPNRSYWIVIALPAFVGAVILLASGQWLWGLVCLAVGIVPAYIAAVGLFRFAGVDPELEKLAREVLAEDDKEADQ